MRIDASTRAIVTGASRGIGRAIAEALAARGATVGVAARTAEDLEAMAARGSFLALPCDVGDRDAVTGAVERFVSRTGGLELVVANAGIAHYGPFADLDLDRAEQMTRVNWLGTLHTVKAALAHLQAGGGHIVIVSSGAGLRTFPGAAVYGGTKAAQRGFAEGLRHELAGTGVSVTTVFPGEFHTNLHDHERDRLPAWYRGGPNGGDPAELAAAVVRAVEEDRRAVHLPALIRLLGLNGIAPGVVDALLRRLRGRSAAPRGR